MKLNLSVIALAAVLPLATLSATAADAPSAIPPYVTAALNAPARKDDAANDARRQAAAVVTFAGVKPGDSVVELLPGSGYWTRIFSGIVGAKGHVTQVWADEMHKYDSKSYANWQELSKKAPYTNVSFTSQGAATLGVKGPVDVVFTSQNYHDYHDPFMGSVDMAKFNKQVFDALKPGGVYVIIDNTAAAASGFSATDTLHRVDPEAVKKEVEAAGFVFDGSSDALRNPADTHDKVSYEPPMAGHNDQFIFRFRKPTKV